MDLTSHPQGSGDLPPAAPGATKRCHGNCTRFGAILGRGGRTSLQRHCCRPSPLPLPPLGPGGPLVAALTPLDRRHCQRSQAEPESNSGWPWLASATTAASHRRLT